MIQKKIKILLINSSKQNAGLCEEILAKSKLLKCKLVCVNCFEKGREQLLLDCFDVVFLDISESETDCFNFFYSIQELSSETPVVVLTDEKNEKLASKTVREGALNYILRSNLDLDKLEYTIFSAIERKCYNKEIQQSYNLDRLTGLYNRHGFMILAEQTLKFINRSWSELVVVYADVDNLSEINATYGSEEGDRVLCDTAQIFLKTFREADFVARLKSDDFVCMAIETEKTELIIKRLNDNIAEFNEKTKRPYTLSMSFGGEKYKSESPISLEELLQSAHVSMLENRREKISAKLDK